MDTMKAFRELVTLLRKNGLSYGQISKRTGVPKSTLSYWLKAIELPQKHRDRLYTNKLKNLLLGKFGQRERRDHEIRGIISNAEKEVRFPLSLNTYKLMGAMLYWAEGTKGTMFEITNSDPYLILFIVRWAEKVFKIQPHHLTARLNVYDQQDELSVRKFWSELLSIPLKNFRRSYVKPSSTGYKKNTLYYGTIKVTIPKSTDLQYRICGWIQAVLKEVAPRVGSISKRWKRKLKNDRFPVNLQ